MRVGGDVLVWEEEENRKGKQNVERRNSKRRRAEVEAFIFLGGVAKSVSFPRAEREPEARMTTTRADLTSLTSLVSPCAQMSRRRISVVKCISLF
jgi:hypothetical protein